MSLEKHFNSVKNRINKAILLQQNNSFVDLLAVSKKQPLNKIKTLYALGQRKFGESYVQESILKIIELNDLSIQWHFIGPIQSNKTKAIAQHFSWVHSVDSLKVMTRLNKQRPSNLPKLNVLLQLKVGDETSKRGFSKQELLDLCTQQADFEHVNIRGLMSIPAPKVSYNEQLEQFKLCYDAFMKMKKIINIDTLSIGMSGDLEAAIESGATMVRIGSDIFGPRV